jgi:hypothetical protein
MGTAYTDPSLADLRKHSVAIGTMQKTAAFSGILEQVKGGRIFVGQSRSNRQH